MFQHVKRFFTRGLGVFLYFGVVIREIFLYIFQTILLDEHYTRKELELIIL